VHDTLLPLQGANLETDKLRSDDDFVSVQSIECFCCILSSCPMAANGLVLRSDGCPKAPDRPISSSKKTEPPPGCTFLKLLTSYTKESMMIHLKFEGCELESRYVVANSPNHHPSYAANCDVRLSRPKAVVPQTPTLETSFLVYVLSSSEVMVGDTIFPSNTFKHAHYSM
jgi:hypothetical protein